MRTLRYLGIVGRVGLKGEEADKLLETIKSMPDTLGKQEKDYLNEVGLPIYSSRIDSKLKLLDWLKDFGRSVFIRVKTQFISDDTLRINKVKEYMLRLGRVKTIFNVDLEDAIKITSKFANYRIYNELGGYGELCKSMKLKDLLIESKQIDGDEYFVISRE